MSQIPHELCGAVLGKEAWRDHAIVISFQASSRELRAIPSATSHTRSASLSFRNARILPALLALCVANSADQPLLANQLFRVLPSSNIMGANEKLESSSRIATKVARRVVKKGACQWNHSGRPSGWPAAPAEHRSLRNALEFLIANLELKLDLSPRRINKLKFSNRKSMTIFQSENWAASDVRRASQANSWKKAACSPEFLIATDDPTRIGILPVLRNEGSDQRESKGLGWDLAKTLRKTEWREFLIATFANSEIESTRSKQMSKQFSNRNKIAASAFSPPRAVTPIRGSADA